MSNQKSPPNLLVIYTTPWCADCRRVKTWLQQHGISYQEVNLEQDPEAAKLVETLNGGYRSVPTMIFPDGTILVEPSNQELANCLTKLTSSNHTNTD